MIDIAAPWISDLKAGYCREEFWFNKEQCCWDNDNYTGFDEESVTCDQVMMVALISIFCAIEPNYSVLCLVEARSRYGAI